jgi:hypothetical protein
MAWKRATFGWKECFSSYQPRMNVKANIGRFSMIYKIAGSIALVLALLVLGAWNFHTTVSTERTFNALVADVWRVWNDPNSIKKWWGPKGYTALVVRNEVREGGSYLWAMKSAQGRMFLEHRNLQGSRRKQENRVYAVFL